MVVQPGGISVVGTDHRKGKVDPVATGPLCCWEELNVCARKNGQCVFEVFLTEANRVVPSKIPQLTQGLIAKTPTALFLARARSCAAATLF